MLTGKTALVTGSTSGIGKAIATRFAREGCNIVLNGFGDEAEIEAERAGMAKEFGVKVGYANADLTKPDAIEGMMGYVARDFGGADILVNNAGVQYVAPIEEFPIAKWDLIIALNLTSAFHTTRMALGGMKEKGWGRIINTGSAHAKVASPFKSAYVTAKHGLAGLTKVTALEGAQHGVRCNLICPGYVHTPLVDGQIADTAKARGMSKEDVIKNVILDAQPTKQFVTVEQIAGFAAFLCSPDADQINGAELSIDGGWTAA
ncbi:3-hydroxybutyrate dehydrogenase [Hyphomonas oceanitis]|uniref:3-hydroxybutyrate dehydrogenase n=1 Tax=Hyphomonas oceanitis SCH89 TaxID=1280953 RepID=A0A059G7C9_9PROT|nr:3-hydroxybutyrate dehydrogenase [Hyphomonas oceanitis]KDA02742.1 3-hydroxybutyrate dehydrogenase [Hyphomonas oceanitis SCH89]